MDAHNKDNKSMPTTFCSVYYQFVAWCFNIYY